MPPISGFPSALLRQFAGRRSRVSMQKAIEKMAVDKTLINHLRSLKLRVSPNPVIPPNEAKIRLNINDYFAFKAEKKEGIKYLKEVAKLERGTTFEEGMDILSNTAVIFEFIGWISKGISLYNIRAEKGQDAMVDDALTSLYGTQIESNIDRLDDLLTKVSIINNSLDNIERCLMARNQKKKEKARGKGEGEGEEGKGKGKESEGEGDGKGKTKEEGGGQDQDGEGKGGKEEDEDGTGKGKKGEGGGDQDENGGELAGEGEKGGDTKEKGGGDQDGVGEGEVVAGESGSSDGRGSSGNDSDHGDFDIPEAFLDLF